MDLSDVVNVCSAALKEREDPQLSRYLRGWSSACGREINQGGITESRNCRALMALRFRACVSSLGGVITSGWLPSGSIKLMFLYCLVIWKCLEPWNFMTFHSISLGSFLTAMDSHGQILQADQTLVFQNQVLQDDAKPFEVLCDSKIVVQSLWIRDFTARLGDVVRWGAFILLLVVIRYSPYAPCMV